MSYRGDIALGDTLDIHFTTVNASGVPTSLLGTPAVAAYVDNGTVEITAGITLTVDFDARTGLNNVRVVASGANGYATATNVDLVITAGTVDGNSVVGYVVGSFSIENRVLNAAKLATDAVNEIRDAILSDSTPFAGADIDAAISSRAAPGAAMDLVANAVDAAALAADAVDEIWAKTLAELGVGQPPATPTPEQAIMLLYMALRNRQDMDGNNDEYLIYNDAGTVIAKGALSLTSGVLTQAKLVTG